MNFEKGTLTIGKVSQKLEKVDKHKFREIIKMVITNIRFKKSYPTIDTIMKFVITSHHYKMDEQYTIEVDMDTVQVSIGIRTYTDLAKFRILIHHDWSILETLCDNLLF